MKKARFLSLLVIFALLFALVPAAFAGAPLAIGLAG